MKIIELVNGTKIYIEDNRDIFYKILQEKTTFQSGTVKWVKIDDIDNVFHIININNIAQITEDTF